MLGSSPTGGRNAYVLKTRNDDDSSDELLLKGYDTSLTPQPIQSSTSLSTKSPNISYAISHGEISTPNKDNGLEDGNNTEEISVSRPHGGQTRRSKSKSIGHVTASGLNTWKRKPKGSSLTSNQRVHTITTRKTGLGMGMDSTPARRKKGRAGIGNIGLYSTPLATRRRRIEIDQSSSSATISLADPTETPSMTPADVALTSPSWRSTSTIHPLDDPFNMTIPPQVTPSEDQLAEEVTSQTSITAEASSAQVQEMVVPVKFGTSESALTDQSTSSQPIRDSTSGLKLQQETLSHEDFSIPLNDLTQAPGSSMTSQSSDRHLEDEGLTRKTSSKSDLTAKHSKSKTFPSRGTASSHSGEPKRMVDGWSSHGGSSVHGRQSTPYRARGVQRLVDGLGGHDDSGTTNSNSFKTAPETVSLDEVERAERELLEEVEQSRTLDMLWHMDDNQDAPMDQYFDMDVIHNHPEITPPTDLGSEVVEELPSAHSQSEAFQQSYSAEDTRTSSTSDDGQTRAQWHFVRGSRVPQQFLPSSQFSLDFSAYSSSAIHFSPTSTLTSLPSRSVQEAPTAISIESDFADDHDDRRSTRDVRKAKMSHGKWRGAGLLALMQGEVGAARRLESIEEDDGEDTESPNGKRRFLHEGGLVLQGVADDARRRRIQHYLDLERNYQLKVEVVWGV